MTQRMVSLEKVKKLATREKLVVCDNGADDEMPLTLEDNYGAIARVGPCGPPDQEDRANAVLLAHRWNTHDPLVSAFERLFDDWQTLVGQDLRENNADVAKIWKQSEAALKRAKAVCISTVHMSADLRAALAATRKLTKADLRELGAAVKETLG